MTTPLACGRCCRLGRVGRPSSSEGRTVRISFARLVAVAVLAGSGVVAAGAAHAVGTGTYTRITTPAGASFTYQYDGTKPSTSNTFVVDGVTSADVTSVDVDCISASTNTAAASGLQVLHFADNVPVTGGSFHATAAYPQPGAINCRLRAVPTGVDPKISYLASYSGPILYTPAYTPSVTGGKLVAYTVTSARGDAVALLQDAGSCGVTLIATVVRPAMLTGMLGYPQCGFALAAGNVVTGSSSNASTVRVDGHNAYLPSVVSSFLIGTLGLTVPQTAISLTRSTAANGDLHLVERAPLVRCTGTNPDTFPPTSGSCSGLIGTGVTFTRVIDVIRGSHQVRLRDTYTSPTAHQLALQYEAQPHPAPTGATGFTFPGHGSTFARAALDQVVTGLGTKAGSVFVRSDVYAAPDDPGADTFALTWSRAPSVIRFDPSVVDLFGMSYALSLPANGRASLGFAYSENLTTAGASSLAAAAVTEMMVAPSITSPKNRAVIIGRRTTVKGYVTAGANGVPTRVLVNGHAATLTRVSATTSSYRVTFNESYGYHTLRATAYDVAGNAASRSIRVRNKA